MKRLTNEEMKKCRDVSIASLLGLHKSYGRTLRVPCPIHQGKNNNFNIYPDNSFFCFKCGASGKGAIDFYMKFPGVELSEVLTELSKLSTLAN